MSEMIWIMFAVVSQHCRSGMSFQVFSLVKSGFVQALSLLDESLCISIFVQVYRYYASGCTGIAHPL